MRCAYFIIALLLFPAGCTVYHGGVKDVDLHIKDGKANRRFRAIQPLDRNSERLYAIKYMCT